MLPPTSPNARGFLSPAPARSPTSALAPARVKPDFSDLNDGNISVVGSIIADFRHVNRSIDNYFIGFVMSPSIWRDPD